MSNIDYMGKHIFLLEIDYMIQAIRDEIWAHFAGSEKQDSFCLSFICTDYSPIRRTEI